MNASARWVLSPFDHAYHLVVLAGPRLFGVRAARCGQVLFDGEVEHREPPSRPCAYCSAILHSERDIPQARQDE